MSFWADEFLSWWVCVLMILWVDEFVNWGVDVFGSCWLSLVYKPVSWLVLHSSQFTGVLKVKTTSLCFLCMPTKWSKTTTRRMPQCKAPCTDTARCLYPHYKALVVIQQAALYWWIAGRMACKRNSNIRSFLPYRRAWLGITPLDALRNGTAKLVFATI